MSRAEIFRADFERSLIKRVRGETRARELARSVGIAAGRSATVAVVLLGWNFVSHRFIDQQFIGDPASVLSAVVQLVRSGRIWSHLAVTLLEAGLGYCIGVAFGVGLAIIVASFREVALRIMMPFLIAYYSIPKIALAPLIIVWFGLGLAPKIFLAATFVMFVVFMNTLPGILTVSPRLLSALKVMGASAWTIVWRVILPNSMPYLVAGLRISIPESMTGAVIGEFLSGSVGLGYLISASAAQYNMIVAIATVVPILFVVAMADLILSSLERRWLRWSVHEGYIFSRGR